MIRAITRAGHEVDMREVLTMVQAPTVVLSSPDGFNGPAMTRYVAELLPNSEFHVLPPSTKADGIEEFFAPAIDHVERLVAGRHAPRNGERVLATVLFTDIVGSTTLATQLGDERWRVLLDRHEDVLRDYVDASGGRLIKLMGDGSLSTFDGPARAIRCAQGFRDAARSLPLEIRAGLHIGECELVGEDVAGLAVHIGARVSAAAGAGEILVSRTVHDLVAGSGIRFRDRGAHELKGIPGRWELFSLSDGSTEPVAVSPETPRTQATDRFVLAAARRVPNLLRRAGRLARI
jgi:class 3 adenylate cyclase